MSSLYAINQSTIHAPIRPRDATHHQLGAAVGRLGQAGRAGVDARVEDGDQHALPIVLRVCRQELQGLRLLRVLVLVACDGVVPFPARSQQSEEPSTCALTIFGRRPSCGNSAAGTAAATVMMSSPCLLLNVVCGRAADFYACVAVACESRSKKSKSATRIATSERSLCFVPDDACARVCRDACSARSI